MSAAAEQRRLIPRKMASCACSPAPSGQKHSFAKRLDRHSNNRAEILWNNKLLQSKRAFHRQEALPLSHGAVALHARPAFRILRQHGCKITFRGCRRSEKQVFRIGGFPAGRTARNQNKTPVVPPSVQRLIGLNGNLLKRPHRAVYRTSHVQKRQGRHRAGAFAQGHIRR